MKPHLSYRTGMGWVCRWRDYVLASVTPVMAYNLFDNTMRSSGFKR